MDFWHRSFGQRPLDLDIDRGDVGEIRHGISCGVNVKPSTRLFSRKPVTDIFDRVFQPACGREGGADGRMGWVGLRPMGPQVVVTGTVLRIDIPGGAGLGHPGSLDGGAAGKDLRLGYSRRPVAKAADAGKSRGLSARGGRNA